MKQKSWVSLEGIAARSQSELLAIIIINARFDNMRQGAHDQAHEMVFRHTYIDFTTYTNNSESHEMVSTV